MITEAILLISIIIIIILVLLIFKKDWKKYSNISYYEITLFLGSGGHTGELCAMLEGFYF